jgi:hypothetical protein
VPLIAWSTFVAGALAWGTVAVARADVSLRAAPLMGRWRWQAEPGLTAAVLIGSAVVAWGPAVACRLAGRRRVLAAVTGATAMAWTVALAAADGWDQVTAPLTTRHDYEPFAAGIGDIGAFVRGYTDDLAGAPVHVQGHPPGPVVLAWVLDRAGLGGAGWMAVLAVLGWGVAVAAALMTVGLVAGDGAARRAAPVLAVLPAAVWAGTSLDALFAGMVAVAVALAAWAATGVGPAEAGGGTAADGTAAGAGVVLGMALLMSYGAAPFVVLVAAVVVVVAPRRRPVRILVCAAAGVIGVLALAAVAGFWWPAGLAATSERYWAGVGAVRPGLYTTLVGNPAALALAVGPAVAVGLAAAGRAAVRSLVGRENDFSGGRADRRTSASSGGTIGQRSAIALGRAGSGSRGTRPLIARLDRAALLPVVSLAAVVVVDLSQMSRGEVERIWLPFVPWLALAGPGDRRPLLALQVATAVALQATLASPW